jgi:hypothetical protein
MRDGVQRSRAGVARKTGVGDYTSTTAAEKLLASSAFGVDQAVQACSSLDDATRAGWGVFYVTVIDFTKEEPSFFNLGKMMDRVLAYNDQLSKWQDLLESKGCKTTPRLVIERPGTPLGEEIVAGLKYVAVAIAFAGSAYVVGKVVALIPTASQRAGARAAA